MEQPPKCSQCITDHPEYQLRPEITSPEAHRMPLSMLQLHHKPHLPHLPHLPQGSFKHLSSDLSASPINKKQQTNTNIK